ncbi:MAG: hypothetical protein HQ402_00620 [Parcubacteria group bacterium]|nr:hypothetical protein [Parcubacteria group bacterium]
MNNYKIEHKILTLAHCAVMDNKEKPASFKVGDVEFTHWDFNHRDGWSTDAWIATTEVEADNFVDAVNILAKKLNQIIPRIALISQSYVEYFFEPFLIHKTESEVAFFRYIEDTRGGGLMFMENDLKALKKLLNQTEVPESFFKYWKDAVNATGYSAKLLIMFSALEALARERDKSKFRQKEDLYRDLLGDDLTKEIFTDGTGLRNRLIHGEYFSEDDDGVNYLEMIHKKVITYFNKTILAEDLLSEKVVNPQRHFFGNKTHGNFLIKNKDRSKVFELKDVIADFSQDFRNPKKYEHVFDDDLRKSY